jgi:hypothetical protein
MVCTTICSSGSATGSRVLSQVRVGTKQTWSASLSSAFTAVGPVPPACTGQGDRFGVIGICEPTGRLLDAVLTGPGKPDALLYVVAGRWNR